VESEELDIEALKRDPVFQDNLRLLEKEMREEGSLARGYQLLDALLVTEAQGDRLDEVFTFIVSTAFDKLSDMLTQGKGLDMSDPEEWAIARALYEHAIYMFSENETKGAREIFLVLHYLIDHEELSDAMMVHAAAIKAGHDMESFMEKIARVDESRIDSGDPMAFFITSFVHPTDILLQMYEKEVQDGKELLRKMEEASAG